MSGTDPSEREPMKRVLREASSGGLGPGASGRIADGAWARAAEMRRAGAVAPAPRSFGRFAVAGGCAAAALLAAALLFIRGSEPAFAVDGDPVQVLDQSGWDTARAVPLGHWVYVPDGTRAVRTRDGSSIKPGPGAVFRILRSLDRTPAWRVELSRGDAEVSGTSIVLAVSDQMEVVRSLESGRFRVHASLGSHVSARPEPESVGGFAPAAAMRGVVRVLDGEARVAECDGADLLLARPQQAVTTVDIPTAGRLVRRLAVERAWSTSVPLEILRGTFVVGADRAEGGAVQLALQTPVDEVFSVQIPAIEAPSAIAQVNLTTVRATELRLEGNVRIQWAHVPLKAPAPPAPAFFPFVVKDFEHRKTAHRTTISVWSDGSSTLDRDGVVRAFPNLAALREADPAAVALFGERLK